MSFRSTWVVPWVLLGWATVGAAAPPIDFVRDVRPIFERRCYECHGEAHQESGLRLDVKAAALRGGDNQGPDIVPGQAAESPLVRLVRSADEAERMPPDGERLTAAEIEILVRWIDAGAIWPDGVDRAQLVDLRDHWSYKPLADVRPPGPAASATAPSIDAFIDAKLAEQGLRRSPPAEAAVWLRRVTFDLTGLPPTPEEVAAFTGKSEADYAAVVDRLLASPRYGERWAQHWLDVVRYADTHGFEVNTERPHAWPYRDYVIRALNDDVPFDRFVTEQIVGDALGVDAATGFLVTASVLLPGQIGKDEPSIRLARQDAIDEIVNNIGQTFLGLSVGCARCHDHKFDPISQRDYYAMQAFVAGVEYGDRELQTPEAAAARQRIAAANRRIAEIDQRLARFAPLARSGAARPPVNPRENVDRFPPITARRVRFTIRATNQLEPCLDELEVFDTAGRNVAAASTGAVATASGSIVVADRHDLKYLHDGAYGNARSWLSNEVGGGWAEIELAEDATIERVVWGRDRLGKFTDRLATSYVIEVADATGAWRVVADSDDRRPADADDSQKPALFSVQGLAADEAVEAKQLMRERTRLEAESRSADGLRQAFAGIFRTPDEIRLLRRGDPEQPLEPVAPAVPAALGDVTLPADTAEQDRRRALAAWIVDPRNPLTARVIVNRVWQGHFGTGLVDTPSDLGRSGGKPSHPELLDWLAGQCLADGLPESHEAGPGGQVTKPADGTASAPAPAPLAASGWSLKRLHRLIVLSQTYRQSARFDAAAAAVDADVRLLWRYPTRRLEGEAIRDAMLAVSGELNLTMYGPGFDLFDKRGGLTGFTPVEEFTSAGLRRMIYAHKVRRERDAVFGAFDCPDAGQSTARRRESTTPIQALNLLNSRFTLDRAAALAARVRREAGDDVARQIERAYLLALGRRPTPDELAEAQPVVREHGLAVLGRALFNCNEFVVLP